LEILVENYRPILPAGVAPAGIQTSVGQASCLGDEVKRLETTTKPLETNAETYFEFFQKELAKERAKKAEQGVPLESIENFLSAKG